MFIEQGTDLDTEEEIEEDIDGGNPAEGAGAVGRELMGLPVGLEETN